MKQEIIYSLRVMEQLGRMGYIPVATIPNPKNTQYNCWVFEVTDAFKEDLGTVLKGVSRDA